MTTTITPAEARKKLESENGRPALIDVRSAPEYKEVHAEGAVLLPLERVCCDALDGLCSDTDQEVLVICKSGARSKAAAEKLTKEGWKNVCVVEGGTDAWAAEGLPVKRGEAALPLIRQVQITIGGLNLAAAVLALTVHPAFVLLCAFFGAGLLFAGLTGWCGMALMLARMPWNRA